ncbi:hypothetical protein G7Y79_00019g046070 [Physcia stellaris]|nr:hypothetical protein G7Y79_00019g046070 [Physcia stellaris]
MTDSKGKSAKERHDFCYGSIESKERLIRVVQVKPSLTVDGLLQCRLDTVRLDSQYFCLSYTWGSAKPRRQIQVNDHRFYVRRNLWKFLHIARQREEIQPLWIDAICVDQSNVKERNQQVSMMGDIYRNAKEVIVWLGEGDSGLEAALDMVGEKATLGPKLESTDREFRSRLGLRRSDTQSFSSAMDKMTTLPYWDRVWIKQELMLSQNLRFMLFADSTCSEVLDRVYGLLSMAIEGEAFEVDYGISPIELFVRTLSIAQPTSVTTKFRFMWELFNSLRLSYLDIREGCLNPLVEKYAMNTWSFLVPLNPYAVIKQSEMTHSNAIAGRLGARDRYTLSGTLNLAPYYSQRVNHEGSSEQSLVVLRGKTLRNGFMVYVEYTTSDKDTEFRADDLLLTFAPSLGFSNIFLIGRRYKDSGSSVEIVAVAESDRPVQWFNGNLRRTASTNNEGRITLKIYDPPTCVKDAPISFQVSQSQPASIVTANIRFDVSSVAHIIRLLVPEPNSGDDMWNWRVERMSLMHEAIVSHSRALHGRPRKREKPTKGPAALRG